MNHLKTALKTLVRVQILSGLLSAAAWGLPLRDTVFTLLNWGGSVNLENLLAADDVLTVLEGRKSLFRSLDSGRTWRPFPLPEDGSGGQIFNYAQYDPSAKLLYRSSLLNIYAAAPRAGNWTRVFESSHLWISQLDTDAIDGPTMVFRGHDDSIFVSRDRGNTWRGTEIDLEFSSVTSVLAADSCVYLGISGAPVSVSCDGGVSWRTSGSGLLSQGARSLVRLDGAVFAAADSGLVRTLDSGKTWVRWTGGLDVDPPIWGPGHIWGLGRTGSSLILWTDYSRYRSTDGGRSWTAVGFPDSSLNFRRASWELAAVGGSLYTVSGQGIETSADGGRTWSHLQHRSIRGSVQSIIPRGSIILAKTEQGVFVSRDSGVTWDPSLPAADGDPWIAFAGSGPRFAAGSRTGKIRITSDDGSTWSHPLPLPSAMTAVGLSLFGGSFYAAGAGGLWQLSEPDSAWVAVPLPVPDSLQVLGSGRDAMLLAATDHLWEMRPDGSFADRSSGIEAGKVMGAWVVHDVRFAYTSDGYLHRWNTSEAAWEQTFPRFDLHIRSVVAGGGTRLLASTYNRIYLSEDGGAGWRWLNYLPAMTTLSSEGGFLYGGDSMGAFWKLPLASPVPSPISSSSKKVRVRHERAPLGILLQRDRRLDGRRILR